VNLHPALLLALAASALAASDTPPPPPSDTPPSAPALNRLLNLSTRGRAGTGADVLIGGIVLEREARLLVRAVGPGLAAFSVPGYLGQPQLTLLNASGTPQATNRRWGEGDAPAIAAAATSCGAFPLQPGSADSSLLITLPAGSYTAQVSPVDGIPGVVLLEIYLLP
jgi:hypothetical protein